MYIYIETAEANAVVRLGVTYIGGLHGAGLLMKTVKFRVVFLVVVVRRPVVSGWMWGQEFILGWPEVVRPESRTPVPYGLWGEYYKEKEKIGDIYKSYGWWCGLKNGNTGNTGEYAAWSKIR